MTVADFQIEQVLPNSLSETDLDAMAVIIASAFRAKFIHVGLDDDQIYGLNRGYVLDEILSPKNIFLVARRVTDSAICGACEVLIPTLATKEAPITTKADENVKKYAKKLGFWTRLRAGKFLVGMPGNVEKKLGPSEAYVKEIGVLPDCRGKGLGNMLLAKADQVAASHGCTKVSLHVAGFNIRAKQLYERVGYAENKRKSIRGSVRRAVCRFTVGEDGFFYLTKHI